MLLFHTAEVRIVVRCDDIRHIKLRHLQTIFFQLGIDGVPQIHADAIQMLVEFQYIDLVCLDDLRKICFDFRDDHRAEISTVDARGNRCVALGSFRFIGNARTEKHIALL